MSDETLDHVYPGIGRLNFFLAKLGMIAVSVVLVIYFGPDSEAVKIVGIVIVRLAATQN